MHPKTVEAIRQMREKRGPIYEKWLKYWRAAQPHWKRQAKRGIDKYLAGNGA
jgi:hypothetical protein